MCRQGNDWNNHGPYIHGSARPLRYVTLMARECRLALLQARELCIYTHEVFVYAPHVLFNM
jgi:hypothetical protein